MTAKAQARALAKAARARAADNAPGASARLAEALAQALSDLPATTIGGYWPIQSELDPRAAMARLGARHALCLPEVLGPDRPLGWRRWTPGTPMATGPFRTQVPVGTAAAAPHVLLIPLLAFDSAGTRLGYGGGFYDRTLAALSQDHPVTAIGIAYAAQEVPTLPREPTDWPLDAIATERGLRFFGEAR